MNIPKSYEALAADMASEKILSKTLIGQKEAYMMLADKGRLDLATWKQKACEAAEREAALREELESIKASVDGYDSPEHAAQVADEMGYQCIALQQRLTVAEQRSEMLERELKKLRDVAHGCYQIASRYSGCIDGGEESGGDDHDDPSCAIFHRLYYAMFDADAALKPAAEPTIEVARQSLSFENQRIQPARFHCLACGEYHEGSGKLPCPKMKPMSGVKP